MPPRTISGYERWSGQRDRAQPVVGGVRATPPGSVAHPRRQPARPGRRGGAAQCPRRLHPPPGGRLDLGGPGGGDHRVQPGREGLRSSTRPPTRSTAIPRSTRSRKVPVTCEPLRIPPPARATTPGHDAASRVSGRRGLRRWSSTSRCPTSHSTSSAPPGCSSPMPVRWRAPAGTRTRWPTCAATPSSAMLSWSRSPTPTSAPLSPSWCSCPRTRTCSIRRWSPAAMSGSRRSPPRRSRKPPITSTYASIWTVRLGDGTDESHRRMQAAIDEVWPFTHELFESDDVTRSVAESGVGVDPATLRESWGKISRDVLQQATLETPTVDLATDRWTHRRAHRGPVLFAGRDAGAASRPPGCSMVASPTVERSGGGHGRSRGNGDPGCGRGGRRSGDRRDHDR